MRVLSDVKRPVERRLRAFGGDAVDAIADGDGHPKPSYQTRLMIGRPLKPRWCIFDALPSLNYIVVCVFGIWAGCPNPEFMDL